jgi:hypothetical protein
MFADAALAHLASHAKESLRLNTTARTRHPFRAIWKNWDAERLQAELRKASRVVRRGLRMKNVPLRSVEKRKRTAQASSDGSSSAPRRVNDVRRMRHRRPGWLIPSWRIVYERKQRLV